MPLLLKITHHTRFGGFVKITNLHCSSARLHLGSFFGTQQNAVSNNHGFTRQCLIASRFGRL